MRSAAGLVVLAGLGLLTVGCVFRPSKPDTFTTRQRVETFPTNVATQTNTAASGESQPLANHAPLTIYWSEHQVPFIDAADDRDVPYAIGLVHAHLRLGQMEVLRLISQGRLAEVAGPIPIVVDISHALRLIDYPKAAAEIEAAMRPDTRAWLERYVQGLNDYRARAAKRPHEARVLGLEDEAWTLRDIIAIGRLAGTDINWGAMASHLRMASNPHWDAVRARLAKFQDAASPSFGPRSLEQPLEATLDLVQSVGKTGSNSFVVAGSRTRTGKPILANDPHVGFTLPALWCALGYRSPSHHVTGLTIPGIPFVVLGRNPHIAWGGTNMQGISTSLFDVSSLPKDAFTTRTIQIERRFWAGATRKIRESPLGPVITDLPALKDWKGPALAMKWRGHEPSDEYSAFMDASHASTWEEFRAAWKPYAVSGQNFVFADDLGNIGQLLAFEFQPAAGRTGRLPIADPANPLHRWDVPENQPIPSTSLPYALNPSVGYLVSTNNVPVRMNPPVVLNGNWNDRQDRISQLIEEGPLDQLRAGTIQRDVYSKTAHELSKAIVARAREKSIAHPLVQELEAWDGHYRKDSRGALVFQAVLRPLVTRTYTALYDAKMATFLLDSLATYQLMLEDIAQGHADAHFAPALADAQKAAPRARVWGDAHRLNLAHWFSTIPFIGSSFTFGNEPVDGALATVFKSAGPITAETHNSRYGANARQIIDLAHPDEHYIAYVGGQDGWFGSQNFLDLADAWRTGEPIRLPLTIEAVRREAKFVTRIELRQADEGTQQTR
jgi:penicillin amidase